MCNPLFTLIILRKVSRIDEAALERKLGLRKMFTWGEYSFLRETSALGPKF